MDQVKLFVATQKIWTKYWNITLELKISWQLNGLHWIWNQYGYSFVYLILLIVKITKDTSVWPRNTLWEGIELSPYRYKWLIQTLN